MNFREEYLVLIADGDQELCFSASEHLSAMGFKTIIAGAGPQAMELFNELMPHLMILDIGLPGIDCVEFLKQTLVRREGYAVSTLITTSPSRVSDAVHAVHNGAFD